jgi:hypothetical protein
MANFAVFGIGVGLNLISAVLTPPQKVGKLENKSLPEASYGAEISYGFGLFPFRGALTHLPKEYTETKNTRGKIGGKVTEYTYSATMEFLFCEGPTVSFPYITLNGDDFIDFFSSDSQTLRDSQENYDELILRFGNATQPPVGALQAIAPDGIAPPNRDIAFVCFPNWPLTERLGNRPPLVQGLAATSGTMTTLQFNIDTPMPIQWGGSVDSTLALSNTAFFTQAESTTFTAPVDYTYHIAAVDPIIRLTSTVGDRTLSYSAGNWQRVFESNPPVVLVAMDAAEVTQGVFFDLELTGDRMQIYLNGALTDTWILQDGIEYTLEVDSADWAGLEVAKSNTVDASQFIPENVPLADILQTICDRAGIPCDVSEINDLVLGVSLIGNSPSDWLGQLQSIYAFLIVDRGGTIHFLDGDRPQSAYYAGDLDEFGIEEQDLYRIEQKAAEELPYQCEVTYYDLESQQERSAYYRLDTHDENDNPLSVQILNVNTGSTMTEQEALGIAELTLIRAQHERELITLTTTFKHYFLEPGDVLQLPLFGQPIDLLILESNLGANYQIELKCLRYARDAWLAKRTPSFDVGIPTQAANEYARLFAAQGIPKLRTSDPTNPVYFGISHQDPAYRVASAIASIDGGNSYAELFRQNDEARVGMTSKLDVAEDAFTVRVSGELATLSDDTFNNNQSVNRAVIGDEVIQFKTAELRGTFRGWNYYRVETLRRARLGTTDSAHTIWSQFGLAADLTGVAAANIGDSGTTVQIDLLTDGNEQPLPEAEITLA